ncbi:MAG: GNAT family N-acetyltransferase [Aliidongia sp.]
MISLRPAQPGDAAGIARAHVEAWHGAYDGRLPRPMLDAVEYSKRLASWTILLEDHPAVLPTLVAVENDSTITGFATISPGRSQVEEFDGELHMIFVAPAYQRRDLGRRLFHAAADLLRAAGDRSMMAWLLDQPKAAAFLAALGGKPLAMTPLDAFGQRLDQQLYVWPDLNTLPPQPGSVS